MFCDSLFEAVPQGDGSRSRTCPKHPTHAIDAIDASSSAKIAPVVPQIM